MKFISKFFVALAIIFAVTSSCFQIGFICEIKDDLVEIGKKGVNYFLSLHQRIKVLEEQYEARPTIGEEDTHVTTDTQADTYMTETGRVPTRKDPYEDTEANATLAQKETSTPEEQTQAQTSGTVESEAEIQGDVSPSTEFVIAIYDDIIGVFDMDGNLIDTCNVYVMTLPPKDREMLRNGIEAVDWQEVLDILETFI